MRISLLLLTLLLTACLSNQEHSAHPMGAMTTPSLSDASRMEALAGADWSQMKSVSIELRDYGFVPQELRLKAGQPYRLTITNTGGFSHYFNAPEFLGSVAARKAMVQDQAEIKASYFNAFEISRRGGQMEFYFIPMIKGTYISHCHLEGKEHVGVTGALIVE